MCKQNMQRSRTFCEGFTSFWNGSTEDIMHSLKGLQCFHKKKNVLAGKSLKQLKKAWDERHLEAKGSSFAGRKKGKQDRVNDGIKTTL